MPMYHIAICVAYPALQYFALYSIKVQIFYMLLNITCII